MTQYNSYFLHLFPYFSTNINLVYLALCNMKTDKSMFISQYDISSYFTTLAIIIIIQFDSADMSEKPRRSFTHHRTPHSRLISSHQSVKPQNPLRKHKNSDTSTTSKQSESRFMKQFSPCQSLKAVYHSPPEAKYFALILLQDLIRLCSYDIYTYCQMLQILANLTFQGYSETSVKIAITVFHLGSKFFNSNRPRLQQLVTWSHYLVSASDIIACQEQIYRGLNYTLPTHQNLGIDEIKALCFQLEQSICCRQNF